MTGLEHLEKNFEAAEAAGTNSLVSAPAIRARVDFVGRCTSNRAGVRLLLSCMLGKLMNPAVDPRKPYTEIGTDDSFSGRTYDEQVIGGFIGKHRLPCNSTTAYLTPTFRNISHPLTTDIELVGRPREMYKMALEVLEDVATNKISADVVMAEVFRVLILMRDETQKRMASLIESLSRAEGALPLSSEAIVTLIYQHLACKNSSRLPVLIVAAAYKCSGTALGEQVLALNSHNAADLQTGALGDVEICLMGDDKVVTAYEMKMKVVTRGDVDLALEKISKSMNRIHNYLFVTTDGVETDVVEYAASLYEEIGTEIAILDCMGFLRHFLHLFHRLRLSFLKEYQELVLSEPDSAVGQSLKEAFLALRQAAESGE